MTRRIHEGAASLGWDVVSIGSPLEHGLEVQEMAKRLTQATVPAHSVYDTSFVYPKIDSGQWEEYAQGISFYLYNVVQLEQPDAIFHSHGVEPCYLVVADANNDFGFEGVQPSTARDFYKYEDFYPFVTNAGASHPAIIQTLAWEDTPDSSAIPDWPVEALLASRVRDDRVFLLHNPYQYDAFFSNPSRPIPYNGKRIAKCRDQTGLDYIVRERVEGDTIMAVGKVISGTPTVDAIIDVHMSDGDTQYQVGWSWPSTVTNAQALATAVANGMVNSMLTWPDGPFTVTMRIDGGGVVWVLDATPRYDFFAGEVLAHACDFTMEFAQSMLASQNGVSTPVIPLYPTYVGVIPVPTGRVYEYTPGQWNSGIREVVQGVAVNDYVPEITNSNQSICRGYVVARGNDVADAKQNFDWYFTGPPQTLTRDR